MAINYSDLVYGIQNKATATGRTSSNTGDYQTLYNQTRAMPLSGSQAGSADFLANYARQNTRAMGAGMAPVDFNAMLGPEGQVNPNAAVPNTQRSLQDVYNEAYANYLARSTEQQNLARQGIMAAGQDRYQQARLAMEQQRGLSDTRGLTAGAREGAEAQTSAAQQVALNQIEATTRSELLNLKAQGVQDEFLGEQYAMQKVEQFKQIDPGWGKYQSSMSDYQDAINRNDTEDAAKIRESQRQMEAELLGFADDPNYTGITSSSSAAEVSARTSRIIDRVTKNPSDMELLVQAIPTALLIAGGAAAVIGGILLSPLTGGTSVMVTGWGLTTITAGVAAIGAGTYNAAVLNDQSLSNEEKRAKIDAMYEEERKELISLGFTEEQAQAAIDADREDLAPIFR